MRYQSGKEPKVVHPQLGEGCLLHEFKYKDVWWYKVALSNYHIVTTPRSEWKLKSYE